MQLLMIYNVLNQKCLHLIKILLYILDRNIRIFFFSKMAFNFGDTSSSDTNKLQNTFFDKDGNNLNQVYEFNGNIPRIQQIWVMTLLKMVFHTKSGGLR